MDNIQKQVNFHARKGMFWEMQGFAELAAFHYECAEYWGSLK